MQFFIVAAGHSDCRGARTSRPLGGKILDEISPSRVIAVAWYYSLCESFSRNGSASSKDCIRALSPRSRSDSWQKNAPRLARNHLSVTDVSSVAATTLALPDAEARLRSTARSARAAFNTREPPRDQRARASYLVSASPIRSAEVAELLGKRSRVLGRWIDRKRACRQTCH